MKHTGYIILQVAVYLIFIGGIGDIVLTFIENPLPSSHLNFLRIKPDAVSPELRKLDNALLRAIGSCLIAISLGSLVLIYGQIGKGVKWTLTVLFSIITISVGGNALQMYFIDSPFFLYPFSCMILFWTGIILWQAGSFKDRKNHKN